MTNDYVSGIYEVYEYEQTYYIKIYEEESCQTLTTLSSPRIVTICRTREKYNATSGQTSTTVSYYNITVPAGVSSYCFETVSNKENYQMSNPAPEYDVTTISL